MNQMMNDALIAAVSFLMGYVVGLVVKRKTRNRKERLMNVSPDPEVAYRSDRHGQKVVINDYEWTIM